MHTPTSPTYDSRHSPLPLLHNYTQSFGPPPPRKIRTLHSGAGSGSGSANLTPLRAGSIPCLSVTPLMGKHQQQQQQPPQLQPPPQRNPLTAQKRPTTLQLQASSVSSTTLTTVHSVAPFAVAPSDFKYHSPQRSTDSTNLFKNYPFYKARGMRRQSTQSVDSQKANIAGYQPLPMRQRYKHQEVLFELKSPTNRLTIRECDFGGGGEPCDDDQSIKDSQIFRVSKRNLYMNHRTPWKERDRYSNLYEYSINIDLNSIIEDAAGSDSS